MTPTPEQIAAMEARGWTWDAAVGDFSALGKADLRGNHVVSMRVRWLGLSVQGWVASYGVPGIDYSAYTPHPTPLLAADEAEAWLRGVLGAFRFPWLRVEGPT